MFRRIVVGTDGSEEAERAVRVAADLAAPDDGAEVHIVSAYRPVSTSEAYEIRQALPEEFRDVYVPDSAVTDRLARAQAVFDAADVDSQVHEVPTGATDALLDVADDVDADLIVVGSRGLGFAKRRLLGSVSTKLAHHTDRSVLIVHR